jgi:GPH family glycoside/pentoside/hexuronide:cation symporter
VPYGVTGMALGPPLMLFFNQVVGLPAPWVGAAIMISLMLDALCDPFIGQWSDHLESRWGRRHPFMYVSAVPVALAFYLLWNPPRAGSHRFIFAYLAALFIATNLLFSLYEVPSDALAPELTRDYDERTSLLSYRFFFGNLAGTAMALLTFRIFLRKTAAHPQGVLFRPGYEHLAVVGALVIVITVLISALGTHGGGTAAIRPSKQHFRIGARLRQIITPFGNRSFVSLVVAGLCGGLVGGVVAGLDLYIATYFWELSSTEISYFAVVAFVSSLLAVFLAPTVARRMGKKKATLLLMALSMLAILPMPLRLAGLMPENRSFALLALLLLVAFLQNTLNVMAFIIGSSMMMDVVEDVAVGSGQDSAGVLFAANGLVQKSVAGFGTFAAGLVLQFVRFPQAATPGHVDALIMRHLALVFIPLVVGCSAASIGFLTLYRIDRAGHQRNLDRLREAPAVGDGGEESAAAHSLSASAAGPLAR